VRVAHAEYIHLVEKSVGIGHSKDHSLYCSFTLQINHRETRCKDVKCIYSA